MLHFISAFILMAAVPAEAKVYPHCLTVVTGGWNPNEASQKELEPVAHWMDMKMAQLAAYPPGIVEHPEFLSFLEKRGIEAEDLNDETGPEFVSRFFFEQWQRWEDVNERQRAALLSLELDLLSPAGKRGAPARVAELDGYLRLKEISARNLERLKAGLQKKIPVEARIPKSRLEEIEKHVARLSFNFMLPSRTRLIGQAPFIPPRELDRYGLDILNPFYSSFVGKSPSIEFEMVASQDGGLPTVINEESVHESQKLNDEFAGRFGVVMPRFRDPTEVIDFFTRVDPALAEKVFAANKLALPGSITTAEQFRLHLEHNNIDYFFPASSQYERLYPMRARMIDFVLTPVDAAEFFREGFRAYLTHLAATSEPGYLIQTDAFKAEGGIQSVFTWETLPFLGWDRGIALHIPGSIPASLAPVVRIEAAP
jgi:hypothetical protein